MTLKQLIAKWEKQHEKIKHIDHREANLVKRFLKDLKTEQKKWYDDNWRTIK